MIYDVISLLCLIIVLAISVIGIYTWGVSVVLVFLLVVE